MLDIQNEKEGKRGSKSSKLKTCFYALQGLFARVGGFHLGRQLCVWKDVH
jgi:hypothetical protein